MFHQRLARGVFKASRLCTRLVAVLVILLVCAFVFLRVYGVPDPILRGAVRKVNAAGIPVDVDRVALTLRGWRADNVRYYSKHPDDLEPLLIIDHVLFDRMHSPGKTASGGWVAEVEADGIRINPSVEWGVEMPPETGLRKIHHMQAVLGFHPGHISLEKGEASWAGIDFKVDGRVLNASGKLWKKDPQQPGEPKIQDTVLPTFVGVDDFRELERRLKVFEVHGEAAVGIDFEINAADYSKSWIDFSARTTDMSVRGVAFSGAEIEGRYEYPTLELKQAELHKDNRSLAVSGRYDLGTGLVGGRIENTIVSKRMLLLLPQPVMDVLVKIQLGFGYLPEFDIAFGAAKPTGLLNAIEGTFSIKDVAFRGLEVESLRGKVSRRNGRLDLTELAGTVSGQEERSVETGSCMVGGSATGACFWDAGEKTFGVSASGSLDPALLIRPLDMVKVATNVLHRFRFVDQPPQVSLELGSSLVDWKQFYINVHGRANGVYVHGARFSSVNASAYYYGAVLRLDPVAAMQGADFLKGSASLDFRRKTATFDGFGSLNPETIEDLAYDGFNLFGHKIIAGGDTQIKAQGTVDWKTMQATDFKAEVEAASLEIPVAKLDHFKAKVTGEGTRITVSDADFGLYGGKGGGRFSIQLAPSTNALPYEMDVKMSGVDFRQYLQFLRPTVDYKVDGKAEGHIRYQADMATNFFQSASGKGFVAVKDGQLADLPFFSGFSRLIRKVIPSFSVFTITSLQGNFTIKNGVLSSQDANFGGDVIHATAQGSYTQPGGFDALVQARILNDKGLSKIVRVITDPIMKFFELKLTGDLKAPHWRLEKFSGGKESGESN